MSELSEFVARQKISLEITGWGVVILAAVLIVAVAWKLWSMT